jgi:hypothetical protein
VQARPACVRETVATVFIKELDHCVAWVRVRAVVQEQGRAVGGGRCGRDSGRCRGGAQPTQAR